MSCGSVLCIMRVKTRATDEGMHACTVRTSHSNAAAAAHCSRDWLRYCCSVARARRLRKQVEYWKEQAGLVGAEARAAAELAEIENRRGGGGGDSPRDTPAAVAAAGAALAPVAEASDGGGEAAGGGGSAGEAAGEQE